MTKTWINVATYCMQKWTTTVANILLFKHTSSTLNTWVNKWVITCICNHCNAHERCHDFFILHVARAGVTWQHHRPMQRGCNDNNKAWWNTLSMRWWHSIFHGKGWMQYAIFFLWKHATWGCNMFSFDLIVELNL